MLCTHWRFRSAFVLSSNHPYKQWLHLLQPFSHCMNIWSFSVLGVENRQRLFDWLRGELTDLQPVAHNWQRDRTRGKVQLGSLQLHDDNPHKDCNTQPLHHSRKVEHWAQLRSRRVHFRCRHLLSQQHPSCTYGHHGRPHPHGWPPLTPPMQLPCHYQNQKPTNTHTSKTSSAEHLLPKVLHSHLHPPINFPKHPSSSETHKNPTLSSRNPRQTVTCSEHPQSRLQVAVRAELALSWVEGDTVREAPLQRNKKNPRRRKLWSGNPQWSVMCAGYPQIVCRLWCNDSLRCAGWCTERERGIGGNVRQRWWFG